MGNITAQPNVTVAIVGAEVAVSNTDQQILFIGQKTSAGSAVSGELVQNILNDNSENALFGENSMIAAMVRAAKKENKVTQIDVIPLDDDGGATASVGAIVLTGPATEDGILQVTIGSELNHTYNIAVLSGDTETLIGDAIVTAVTADIKAPVVAVNAAGTLVITAVNLGTYGNDIALGVTGEIAGVTHSVTVMSGGATDPTLTGVLDVVGEKRYQTIVWGYADDVSEVVTFLDARFNVDNNVQDGVAIVSKQDTLANHTAALALLNSNSLVYLTDKLQTESSYAGAAQTEISTVKASSMGSIRALRLTDGASISQYVLSANGPLDAFGGTALASKPYFNTSTPNLPLVGVGRGWNPTEIEQLISAGGSVLGQNPAGNSAIMGEIVTTYKTDIAGNPDISFKFLNYVDTSSGVREYYSNNLRKRFAQSRLTTGDTIRGRDMANDLTIRVFCEKLYQDLSGAAFVLLQAGEDATKFYKDNLDISLDLATGRATITMTVPLVTQLREIIATIKIAFDTNQ